MNTECARPRSTATRSFDRATAALTGWAKWPWEPTTSKRCRAPALTFTELRARERLTAAGLVGTTSKGTAPLGPTIRLHTHGPDGAHGLEVPEVEASLSLCATWSSAAHASRA